MTFNELVDIQPQVRVCDMIQLFLLGYDDKIYFDLNDSKGEVILFDERIISPKWVKFYEYKVIHILDSCRGFILVIESEEQ